MDNQHKKIKGYRDLSQEEIDLMNEIKGKGVELGELVAKLLKMNEFDYTKGEFPTAQNWETDRWIGIGRDHLQQGLMALTRAVAKPEFF